MLKSIGTDLEVFGKSKVGHVALCGKIGGTKEEPKQLKGFPVGFMVQEDNVALEFNIPPTARRVDFIQYIEVMRGEVKGILKDLDLSISEDASATFSNKELVHPNALVFGCEPDYNAWTMKENRKPHSDNQNLRTCGGHVHVGTSVDMIKGVRLMDLYLGVPSVILDDSPSSIARRELYGKAGAMRPKPYGFEYRTLSNFWMFNNRLVAWVYRQTELAMLELVNITEEDGHKIQNCINTGNKEEANDLIKRFGILLPA